MAGPIRGLASAVLTMAAAASALGQLSVADRAAVDGYRSALGALEGRAAGSSLETVLRRVDGVRDALVRPRENGTSALESLSGDDLDRLRRDLKGLLVNRDEAVFVRPDPDYFAGLAATYGVAADRRFFAAYKATYPDGVWPAYVHQQTDYSGCTRFGSGKLVEAYRTWSEFRRTVPDRYIAAATEEVDRAAHELAESTCACGDRPSVERELQEFVRAFPSSPIQASIVARLRALGEGRSPIRLSCVSG